jgi:hypothetical protein
MTKAREATLAMLAARPGNKSVCPSEIARVLATSDGTMAEKWRDKMSEVHAAVDSLLAERVIQLSWKGRPLAERSGPYRILVRRGH